MERAENTRNTATAERVVRTTRPPGRSGGGSLTDTDQDVVKACLASRSSRCSAGSPTRLATLRSAGFVGVPAALQVGLAAFSVVIVVAGLVALVGFAAASWRLGDALFRVPRLRRYNGRVPAPLIALLGATLIYISWQLPYLGAIAVVGVLAYALGAVVTARLAPTRARRPRPRALIHEGGRER